MEMTKQISQRKQGGMLTMPFIFANEICEKLAVVGFGTNMLSYLTSELHLPLTQAANTLTNFVSAEAKATPLPSLPRSEFRAAGRALRLAPADGAGVRRDKAVRGVFFNWYYFCMGASNLVANTVIIYIQDNIGWGWGLGIPTAAMFLSVVAFVTGYPLYRKIDPAGSPFTRLIQVAVAAFRTHDVIHNDQITHRFLDKAAVASEEDKLKEPNAWRLSTVHRVEELKSLIQMGPIWAAGILLITASAQQNTFSLQQAKHHQNLPNPSRINERLYAALHALHHRLLRPPLRPRHARRLTGLNRGVSFLTRMAVGFIEIRSKQAAGLLDSPHEVMPQYCLHWIAEAFMSIGHLEFFYDQAPESMRSTATALFGLSISAGSYTSTLLVRVVQRVSDWLPDRNLNRGKLEYLYWLITLLQLLNLVYYLICAKY
ncbi:hypothetical protein SASPL_142798 [Salvia splendens]|uniref:Solute carrier family 15 (Peptide/histidine transporter), member 3/4 n=1 Tax=Salvia splendens TaxID=180675 RepID=A0A8X8Z9Q4_SALSN|nr:hypothetical protein SASPL_142798 [Salvia splendens]